MIIKQHFKPIIKLEKACLLKEKKKIKVSYVQNIQGCVDFRIKNA